MFWRTLKEEHKPPIPLHGAHTAEAGADAPFAQSQEAWPLRGHVRVETQWGSCVGGAEQEGWPAKRVIRLRWWRGRPVPKTLVVQQGNHLKAMCPAVVPGQYTGS